MLKLGLRSTILAFVAIAATQACSSDDSTSKPNTSSTTGGGTTGPGVTTGGPTTGPGPVTTGDTTSGGSGGSGGGTTTTGTGGGSGDAPAPLPFVVDSLFIASGYMGDGSVAGAIMQEDNMGACAASRPAGAVGHCHKFTYTPQTNAWGGVYWQYPVNNWGATPGKRIASGATKVTFYAAGAAGGETVKFIIGGIMGMTYTDSFKVEKSITLTNTMAPYIVDLTGQTYDAVLGGFGWVIEAPMGSTAPIGFTVDSITWDQ